MTHPTNARNWAIWREYRTTKTTYAALAKKHGVSGSRVGGIVHRYDRMARIALSKTMGVPMPDGAREGLLGVEFVFGFEPHDGDWRLILATYDCDEHVAYKIST